MKFAGLLFRLANVRCEQCQAQLKLEDVNAGAAMVCSACEHEMPILVRGENTAHISFDKNLVKPSEEVVLQREGSISILHKHWRSKYSKYVISFAFLWNLGCGAAIYWIYSNRHDEETLLRSGATAFLCLLGFAILYRGLQELLNKTTIMLKNDKLVVGTSPIFWGAVKIYRTDEIASLTVWRMDPDINEGRPRFSFGVDLHTKDGRLEKLCPASDLNEAIYIEKTLEELLHIESGASVDHFAV
jgi:hypothetical protein